MFKIINVLPVLALTIVFAGCGQAGRFASTSLTQVEAFRAQLQDCGDWGLR